MGKFPPPPQNGYTPPRAHSTKFHSLRLLSSTVPVLCKAPAYCQTHTYSCRLNSSSLRTDQPTNQPSLLSWKMSFPSLQSQLSLWVLLSSPVSSESSLHYLPHLLSPNTFKLRSVEGDLWKSTQRHHLPHRQGAVKIKAGSLQLFCSVI